MGHFKRDWERPQTGLKVTFGATTLHNCTLHTAHCTLHTAHCTTAQAQGVRPALLCSFSSVRKNSPQVSVRRKRRDAADDEFGPSEDLIHETLSQLTDALTEEECLKKIFCQLEPSRSAFGLGGFVDRFVKFIIFKFLSFNFLTF